MQPATQRVEFCGEPVELPQDAGRGVPPGAAIIIIAIGLGYLAANSRRDRGDAVTSGRRTSWTPRDAADGHPIPFGCNEEGIRGHLWQRDGQVPARHARPVGVDRLPPAAGSANSRRGSI
jgi:hypothetical protein